MGLGLVEVPPDVLVVVLRHLVLVVVLRVDDGRPVAAVQPARVGKDLLLGGRLGRGGRGAAARGQPARGVA